MTGQPLSIIEALAFSTPVISCYHKGIPELIEAGVSGIFVEPRSPQAIAQALLEITNDVDKYAKMSENARLHYNKHFNRDVHLTRLIDDVLYGH